MHQQVLNNFKSEYKYLYEFGLEINGITEINGVYFIDISYPFVFDARKLPKKFQSLFVRGDVSGELPIEFQIDEKELDWYRKTYLWAPERFEKYVDRCGEEIRKKLKQPNMTREEMLDALCFGDFQAHKKMVEKKISEGVLPAYQE